MFCGWPPSFSWWDDLRTDASKEPAWAPFELAATALAAGDRGTASEPCGTTRGGGGACRPPEPVPAFVDDASREAAVRAVLDPHVDRCWAPRYHPQRFGPEASAFRGAAVLASVALLLTQRVCVQ